MFFKRVRGRFGRSGGKKSRVRWGRGRLLNPIRTKPKVFCQKTYFFLNYTHRSLVCNKLINFPLWPLLHDRNLRDVIVVVQVDGKWVKGNVRKRSRRFPLRSKNWILYKGLPGLRKRLGCLARKRVHQWCIGTSSDPQSRHELMTNLRCCLLCSIWNI